MALNSKNGSRSTDVNNILLGGHVYICRPLTNCWKVPFSFSEGFEKILLLLKRGYSECLSAIIKPYYVLKPNFLERESFNNKNLRTIINIGLRFDKRCFISLLQATLMAVFDFLLSVLLRGFCNCWIVVFLMWSRSMGLKQIMSVGYAWREC